MIKKAKKRLAGLWEAVSQSITQYVKAALEAGEPYARKAKHMTRLFGMSRRMPGPGPLLAAFASGMAVGATMGIAFAPASGSQTRSLLATRTRDFLEKSPLIKRVLSAVLGERPIKPIETHKHEEPAGGNAFASHDAVRDAPLPASAHEHRRTQVH